MAKQDVNFRQGGPITGDSGERGNDPLWGPPAIKPNTDGERAVAANFDRPLENLRKRTEVLRGEMEGQKYLQDTDMRWVISSGKADGLHDWGPIPPKTEWPLINEWHEWMGDPLNRWFFVLEPNIAVVAQPLNTPAHDLQEIKYWEFPTPTPANGVNISMLRRAYSLANIREVVWEAVPSAQIVGTHGTPLFVDLTLSGENSHILTITIRDDDFTLLGHLANAFTAWNAAYLVPAGFSGSTTGAPGNAVKMSDIPLGDVDYIFERTADRELHYITAETFRDFFNASLDNLMSDGDTLAVMWEYLVNPDPLLVDGRRQAIPSNSGMTEVLVPRLFLTTVHPEWIPLGIPLCKRIGKELLWLDGTLVTEAMSTPIRFGENGYTVERIMHAGAVAEAIITTPWFGPIALSGGPPWTIDSALNNIIGDLALSTIPSGALRMGMHTTAAPAVSLGVYNVPPLGDSAAAVFEEIITLLDTKASLNRGVWEAEEKISGRWEFDNHVRIGQDKAVIRTVPSNTDWHLAYRNFCAGTKSTPVNADINTETYSIYESSNDASGYGQVLEVFGGYMVDWNTVRSAADGIGNVSFVKWGNHSTPGAYVIGYRFAAGASTDLNIYDEHDWDYYRVITYNAGEVTEEIFGGWGGGRPPTTEIWFIPQEYHSGVTFADLSHADGPARIVMGNTPWCGVLEGCYALPEDIYSPALWNSNCIRISSGRVLVNGKPIMIETQVIHNLNSKLMNGVVLPTDDADPTKIPAWYYLWLRSDGEFFIGEKPPLGDWAVDCNWPVPGSSVVAGNTLYRPDATEIHATFAPRDYTLLDVVYLMQYVAPGNWYFDCAPPIGGGERRFLNRLLPSTLAVISHKVAHVAGAGVWFNYPLNQNPTANHIRTPGIPNVSKNAVLAYSCIFSSAGGAGSAAFAVHISSNVSFYPPFNVILYPPFGILPGMAYYWKSLPVGSTSFGDNGVIGVVPHGNQISFGTFTAGDGALDISLYLLGFKWDRNSESINR